MEQNSSITIDATSLLSSSHDINVRKTLEYINNLGYLTNTIYTVSGNSSTSTHITTSDLATFPLEDKEEFNFFKTLKLKQNK